MPANNMGSPTPPAANPITGEFVLMSPFSGPKGSPFDAMSAAGTYTANGVMNKVAEPNNFSTGGLSTGIGFGVEKVIAPGIPAINEASFTDDYTPGLTMPDGTTLATLAVLLAIGGGKNALVNGTGANGNGTPPGTFISAPAPYVAQPLLGFGAGGARDAGAGPAFTGFAIKMVTAAAPVAVDAAIEAGWVNRSGVAMATGQSDFGVATAASPAVTEE